MHPLPRITLTITHEEGALLNSIIQTRKLKPSEVAPDKEQKSDSNSGLHDSKTATVTFTACQTEGTEANSRFYFLRCLVDWTPAGCR